MMNAASKPDLVLLHGWGLGSPVWQAALPALTRRFRVHPFSLPGYRRPDSNRPGSIMDKHSADGMSQSPHEQTASEHTHSGSPSNAASKSMASSALSFERTSEVLTQALPEGCVLCGWSLGGLLAMQTAALAPQRFKALVLVGSTARFTQANDWPHAQPAGLLAMFSAALARNPADVLQRFVSLLNQGDTQARAISRAMNQQLLASPLPDTPTLLAGLDWLRDVDLRPQLTRISTPTLLIHGEHDPLMPLPAVQWLAQQLPKAQLEVIAGAAHAPFLTDPDAFARHIGEFCHAPAFD